MTHLRTVFTLKIIQRVPSLKPSLILETVVFFGIVLCKISKYFQNYCSELCLEM